MLSSLNCLVSFQNHSCTKAIFKKMLTPVLLWLISTAFYHSCSLFVGGLCEDAGKGAGPSAQLGVGAVVRRLMRAERDDPDGAARTRTADTGMHTKCCVYELWQTSVCEEKTKKKKNETANDKRRKLPLVHVEAFAQEAHLPQKTPSRQSSRRCASAVHESLRLPCRVQDWNRAALTTECGGYCWVSAPYPRLRPHTNWHHRQDGVNDLHEIHRRISAVRGAGEVRELFFFVLFRGFFPPIIIIFIWHHLCMKCQPVM